MKEEEKDIVKVFLTELMGGMKVVVTMLLLALLFGGCAHKTFEEVEKVHDTLRVYQYHRDSVIHRDSVFLHVYERGDTVYHVTERWNVQYKDRVRVDTVYQVRDVAQQSKEVVEKKSNDMFFIKCGAILMGLLALVMAVCFAGMWWDKRKEAENLRNLSQNSDC